MMASVIAVERMPARTGGDTALAIATALVAGMGIMALYSASYAQAARLRGFPEYFLARQAVFVAIGTVGALILSMAKPETIRRRIMPLTIFTLLIQVLPFLPIVGVEKNGARRWVDLGIFEFQPSELLKPALAAYLAHILAKKAEEEKSGDLLRGTLPPLLVTGLAALLVFAQNDLSSAVIVLSTGVAAFWISGLPLRVFAALVMLILPLGALGVMTSAYRFNRIITYLFPGYDPRGIGYQLLGSLTTVRSGGLFGTGVGMGTHKLSRVSEVQTDFIFASVAEEVGFLGVLAVMSVLAFLLFRAFRASWRCPDAFGRYLAFALASGLSAQILMNLGVVAGLVPPTGITLPLFSAGGTSMAVTLCALGLVHGVSRRGEAAHV